MRLKNLLYTNIFILMCVWDFLYSNIITPTEFFYNIIFFFIFRPDSVRSHLRKFNLQYFLRCEFFRSSFCIFKLAVFILYPVGRRRNAAVSYHFFAKLSYWSWRARPFVALLYTYTFIFCVASLISLTVQHTHVP